ncbi:protein kinase C-binding protein NELL1-like [Gadus macrocephalus]|uniref:protein kinase C-binding protein NELL1-like n=1 Tax=Gadus macrocephalus TaxID=80720 RepID=UPI0028CB8706|nr:protein kinase C-binding protein NELL1-like [Gadus macrocephalus]
MDILVTLIPLFFLTKPVLGFGSDQDYQIDIINELDLANATYGITQVAGLHNSSKAFLFRDVGRAVYAPEHLTERVVQMFRSKTEFTFLASIQQKASTSGVIFSIHESEHSYFELESSGVREEIRYHYRFNGKPRSESFPYRLADGQWHKVALTVSATHLLLHVDCNRIYERLIDPPQTELTAGSGVWLGQHTHKHGLFKGVIQDVKLIFAPNGYISQCPNLNRTCPTCSDFLSLVQGIMDLQEVLAKMTLKLNYAETRLTQLEGCHCERMCSANGLLYRDKELWLEPENCRNCACKVGVAPPPPPLHQSLVDIDECATQMHYCQSNTACVNLPGSHRCDCLPGFIRVDEYSCTERDECAAGQSSCDDNAICTNTIRGHLCTCKPGYVGNGTTCRAFCEDRCRNGGTCVSPNSCVCPSGFTGRHCETDIDECAEGLIECHNRSHCVNLPGWYHCECRDGYHDNGSYLLDGGSCAESCTKQSSD